MLIVLTTPTSILNEHTIIHQLFEQGLQVLHIYKPDYTLTEKQAFAEKIAPQYQRYCVFHDNYKKFHSLTELYQCKEAFEYAFLSPVFDSISKIGHKSPYIFDELKKCLKAEKRKIIALGGVDEDKIDIIKELGFYGIAVLGAIWQHQNPVEKFKSIQKKWTEKNLLY